jgi:CheY-like chemotaxis protein
VTWKSGIFEANNTISVDNNIRILLVEDDRDSGFVFELILSREGYEIDNYVDPIKALSAFKPKYYDLIITDYFMAGLNGLGFIQNIRKFDDFVKAILLTAWEPQSIGDEVQKWFVKVLGKPVSEEKLIKEVRLALA